MPKVTRRDAQQPLQEAATAMDTEGGAEGDVSRLPDKPGFAPLSASDAEQKVEFRRVSVLGWGAGIVAGLWFWAPVLLRVHTGQKRIA
eukprot:868904-Pelagomonas_calceolata.AAC.3